MSDIITTLHPENDANINLYPNIKGENIPVKSIDRTKLDDNLNSLLDNVGSLTPSGVDTASNILAKTSNTGIWIGSDTGMWYYWSSNHYVEGGVYQNIVQDSITPDKTTFVFSDGINVLDNSTVEMDKIWTRQYGNPSIIYKNANASGFCFSPINLKANNKYNLTNCRFSNTLILIGTWDISTNAYTGTYYTIENCPFATYTTGSVTGFGTAIITPTSDCILFFTSTTLQNIGDPTTSMVFEGNNLPDAFVVYRHYLNLKMPDLKLYLSDNVLIVSKSENNLYVFNTIQSACDSANDGDTILILPGEYYESVVCINKTIHIKGLDKTSCVLYYDSNTYQTMPLSIASGSVENLTIYAKKQEGATSTNMPYAVHIDFNYSYGKSLHFDNCVFKNDWQSSVGIGLKGGFNLSFKNCDFISYANTTNGALFFHDNVESGYYGTSNIKLDTCNIWCDGDIAIMPTSFGSTDNTTNMTFYRTLIYSTNNGHTNASVGVGRAVTGDGWRQYNNFFLTNDSFGNSNNLFNHS